MASASVGKKIFIKCLDRYVGSGSFLSTTGETKLFISNGTIVSTAHSCLFTVLVMAVSSLFVEETVSQTSYLHCGCLILKKGKAQSELLGVR